MDAGFKAICTRRSKARRREPVSLLQGLEAAMPKIKRDLRGGEWRRTRVVNVLSDRVNLHFFTERDAAKGKRRRWSRWEK